MEIGAAALILVHNHPSGIAERSIAHKAMTRQIVTAARTIGVSILEHLIVTPNGCFSFRAEGLF